MMTNKTGFSVLYALMISVVIASALLVLGKGLFTSLKARAILETKSSAVETEASVGEIIASALRQSLLAGCNPLSTVNLNASLAQRPIGDSSLAVFSAIAPGHGVGRMQEFIGGLAQEIKGSSETAAALAACLPGGAPLWAVPGSAGTAAPYLFCIEFNNPNPGSSNSFIKSDSAFVLVRAELQSKATDQNRKAMGQGLLSCTEWLAQDDLEKAMKISYQLFWRAPQVNNQIFNLVSEKNILMNELR